MEDRWLRLMASLAGTPEFEWMLNTIGSQVRQTQGGRKNMYHMEEMIEKVPIRSRGVMYHPYLLAGGRGAFYRPACAGQLYGDQRAAHTWRTSCARRMRGVAFAMLDCYQHMPGEIKRLTVCGGGANSAVWCQMFADAVGTQIL